MNVQVIFLTGEKKIMNSTKRKILEAATEVFIQKGFSGASISDIAGKAGINQSLIYHHIGNKENLWKEVKRYLLADHGKSQPLEDTDFNQFISHIIKERVEVYDSDPRILRLIQWQALEDQQELQGGTASAPLNWIKKISSLQESGNIKSNYPAHLITVFIYSLINGAIMDNFAIFSKNRSDREKYIQMIHQEILNIFGTEKQQKI